MAKLCIVAGSKNDISRLWQALGKGSEAAGCKALGDMIEGVGITEWSISAISAHRNPHVVHGFCVEQTTKGPVIFLAIAGMAAHLAGAIAAETNAQFPVLGVAMPSPYNSSGSDAASAMSSMPPGTPVMYMGVGEVGLQNAVIAAGQIYANGNSDAAQKLAEYRAKTNKNAEVEFLTSQTLQQEGVRA